VMVSPDELRVIAASPNFEVVKVLPSGPRVIQPSPNLVVVYVFPSLVRVIKPSPKLLVVEVPEIPGMTTGTLGSLSLPQTVADEENKIARQRQINGRSVFIFSIYPMGQDRA